jgi:hypothetical protein
VFLATLGLPTAMVSLAWTPIRGWSEVRKVLVVGVIAVGLVVALGGTASAANEYSAWVSCQHGFSIDMSGWPEAYTVTITDNRAPFTRSSNTGRTKFSHLEMARTALPVVDRTIPHTFFVDVSTPEQGQSFTDTIELPACGASWPGYVVPSALAEP